MHIGFARFAGRSELSKTWRRSWNQPLLSRYSRFRSAEPEARIWWSTS